ncbi:MAG: nuclear transport factor 2 family protein [Gemmatirosa sp.]|nr:nuclear transport factor 2 family protein [Gemmatirosa sp.]
MHRLVPALAASVLLAAALPSHRCHAQAAAAPTPADSAAIRATALDYVEGWYTADADRMERAIHPDLAKRIARTDPTSGRTMLESMGAMRLVQGTRRGGGRTTPAAQQQKDVAILDVFGNAASVRTTMSGWIDYMHMAKVDGRWTIVNVLWELKPGRP